MSFHHRISTVYWKELTDILRDRRTLIAMVVVPIVLYPLLMLGSVQAISYQSASLDEEQFIIGTASEPQMRLLQTLIRQDESILNAKRATQPEDSAKDDAPSPTPLQSAKLKILAFATYADLEQAVLARSIHAGVVFESDMLVNSPDFQNKPRILADMEEMRGRYVANELKAMLDRTGERIASARKRQAHLPQLFDRPIRTTFTDVSSPPSILGQILPLVLILMTITGAIYPAIDLTAGERERGTLESLMVCPVPTFDLITGKFLVVTTIAIMGAALNLTSVSMTVYFGGFDVLVSSDGQGLPFDKLLIILVCLIPFAVFMSAIMIAVCSYARTFKEAQNYVTPVILAVLIPGGMAALPATRLEGVMTVMPVGNMVLLSRELLMGAQVSAWTIAMVVISTSLYACASVAFAASIFGKETVVFADASSFKASLSRSVFKPAPRPTVAQSMLWVSLLFPAWFFFQSYLSPHPDEDASRLLYASGAAMPMLFVLLPATIMWYLKINLRSALSLKMPSIRHLLAAVLIGVASWIPAHEIQVLQAAIIGIPESLTATSKMMGETIAAMPQRDVLLLIAVIPALCEELLFRGFLMGGLASSRKKWLAIIGAAAIFALFHFVFFRFAVSGILGIVLGYVCWQSRSIVPAIIIHLLHNGIGVLSILNPSWPAKLGISSDDDLAHLPVSVLAGGSLILAIGWLLASRPASEPSIESPDPSETLELST